MTIHYQLKTSQPWSVGQEAFSDVWANAHDKLRFHRGEGFRIVQDTTVGVNRPLRDIQQRLETQMTSAPFDTVFAVRSERDGYAIKLRRHEMPMNRGLLLIEHAAGLRGTPYVFGATDCSWLTKECVNYISGIELVHNAHAQRLDPRVVPITRSAIKPGDLLFHHADAHVSIYLDDAYGGRVWDTEPHDTAAPWGGMQGTGVRIRSMAPRYYCEWADVNGIGRIPSVNGEP